MYYNLLFQRFLLLNMFRATYRSSSGAQKLYLQPLVYIHGSVHNNINYLEITKKMRPCIRIYYSNVSYCSTCFERHIAHHQELNMSAVSGRQPQTYVNQRLQIQFLGSWWWATCPSKHA